MCLGEKITRARNVLREVKWCETDPNPLICATRPGPTHLRYQPQTQSFELPDPDLLMCAIRPGPNHLSYQTRTHSSALSEPDQTI